MSIQFAVAPRDDVPRWLSWGGPVLTIAGALLVGSLLLLVEQADPAQVYIQMFLSPFLNVGKVTNILIRTSALVLVGLAVYLPLKNGLWNIGAEGQFYVGGIISAAIGLGVDAPAIVLLPLIFLGGAIAGAVWGFIPGYLLAKWETNEIITTLLLTFTAIQFNQYVIRGPLQGEYNFPSSDPLPSAARLPMLGDTGLHAGILLAVLALIGVHVLMEKSYLGLEITYVGASPEAAEQAGISQFKTILIVMTIGGLLAGIAGMTEIAGVQSRLQEGFSPGYGFTAIPIALLGRNGVVQIFLASVFFALLYVGGATVSSNLGIPSAITDIIQALVILFLIATQFFERYTVTVSLSGAAVEV